MQAALGRRSLRTLCGAARGVELSSRTNTLATRSDSVASWVIPGRPHERRMMFYGGSARRAKPYCAYITKEKWLTQIQ